MKTTFHDLRWALHVHEDAIERFCDAITEERWVRGDMGYALQQLRRAQSALGVVELVMVEQIRDSKTPQALFKD